MAAESMMRAAGMEQYTVSAHDSRPSDLLERVRHFTLPP